MAAPPNCALKYTLLSAGSSTMVAAPGVQPAGHTSPCSAWNWNAWISRRAAGGEGGVRNRTCPQESAENARELTLINRAADGKVVDRHLPQDAFRVDDKQAAQRDTSVVAILQQHTVVAGDLLGDVRDQGDVHRPEATVAAVLLSPRQVAELGINGARNHLRVKGTELSGPVRERNDLCRQMRTVRTKPRKQTEQA